MRSLKGCASADKPADRAPWWLERDPVTTDAMAFLHSLLD